MADRVNPNPFRVMTAPLALIKVDGITIGKMKNIRCEESIQRTKVIGLGQLVPDELPPLSWEGTLTCGFFLIDLRKSQIPGAINRLTKDIDEWTNSILLQEDGVDITIYKKVKQPIQQDKDFPLITNTDPITGATVSARLIQGGDTLPGLVEFANVRGCFINRESFDISAEQIGGKDVSFQYLNPILFSGV